MSMGGINLNKEPHILIPLPSSTQYIKMPADMSNVSACSVIKQNAKSSF
jgi:hypothetical protein